jgi:hypothetical protein
MAWRIRRWSAPSEALCRWAIAADRVSAWHGAARSVQSSSDQDSSFSARWPAPASDRRPQPGRSAASPPSVPKATFAPGSAQVMADRQNAAGTERIAPCASTTPSTIMIPSANMADPQPHLSCTISGDAGSAVSRWGLLNSHYYEHGMNRALRLCCATRPGR